MKHSLVDFRCPFGCLLTFVGWESLKGALTLRIANAKAKQVTAYFERRTCILELFVTSSLHLVRLSYPIDKVVLHLGSFKKFRNRIQFGRAQHVDSVPIDQLIWYIACDSLETFRFKHDNIASIEQ